MTVALEELKKIHYLDAKGLEGREVITLPLWDGQEWHMWLHTGNGQLTKMKIGDPVLQNYVATTAEHKEDLIIPFNELLVQQLTWPELTKLIYAIQGDIHQLATCCAKLRFFSRNTKAISPNLATSFVATELEYLVILSRGLFDLLHKTIAVLLKERVRYVDPGMEAKRKATTLPATFTKMVLGQELFTIDEIVEKFGLPHQLAEAYATHAPFFRSLRDYRNGLIHNGTELPTIFETEKGFCISLRDKTCVPNDIWGESHRYNENLVSMLPWASYIIFHSLGACHQILTTMSTIIKFPDPLYPELTVFIRDPNGEALWEMLRVLKGEIAWWDEPKPED